MQMRGRSGGAVQRCWSEALEAEVRAAVARTAASGGAVQRCWSEALEAEVRQPWRVLRLQQEDAGATEPRWGEAAAVP